MTMHLSAFLEGFEGQSALRMSAVALKSNMRIFLQEVGKEAAAHRRTERHGRLQEAGHVGLTPCKDKDL